MSAFERVRPIGLDRFIAEAASFRRSDKGDLMGTDNWGSIFVGVLALTMGIIAIVARKRLASGIAEGQRTMFGRAGEKIARQSKPAGLLVAGIGGVLIGVTAIILGIVLPPEAF